MTYLQYIAIIEGLKAAMEGRIIGVIPAFENFAYQALIDWIDESMNIRAGKLVASEETISILNDFDSSFLRVLNGMKAYKGAVSSLLKELPKIGNAIEKYQTSANGISWAAAEVNPVQKMVVNEIMKAYTENGLNKNFVQPLRDLLYQNIVAGASLKEVKEVLKDYVKSDPNAPSKISRYLTQTAQQAVDSYSGAINKKLMDKFDYPYLQMSGSLIATSSPQCVRGIQEFDGLISRDTWKEVIEPLAKKHGLIEGTTFNNLPFNRLHWGCRHEFTPTMVKGSKSEFDSISNKDYPVKEKFPNGGFYAVHKNADKRDSDEYTENVKTAKALAEEKGLSVFVREHIKTEGVKNPEYQINGLISDRKQPAYENTFDKQAYKTIVNPISQSAKAAQKQRAESVVISVFKRYNIEEIEQGIKYGFKDAPSMKEIIINFRNKKFAIIKRSDFEKGKILENLKNDYLEPLK